MADKPTDWGRKRRQTSMQFNEGDEKLVEYIAEYLGSSKSDAIRSAIRAYAMHLQTLKGG